MSKASPLNLLGFSGLHPRDLGRLVAEVVLSEAGDLPEGWQIHVGDLIESAMVIIHAQEGVVTLRTLVSDLLTRDTEGRIPLVRRLNDLPSNPNQDVVEATRRLQDFYGEHTTPEQRRFVRQIIQRSLSELKEDRWSSLSDSQSGVAIYDEIVDSGKVLLLSVGQGSPAFQRSLCTLVKAVFQQAVLTRGAEVVRLGGEPKFTLLACDEYAQVATESISGLVSDSRFMSLSREYRCMSLLALQSVATGRSRFGGHLRDRWDAILGNTGAKIFMRLNDVETAELASNLVGRRESEVPMTSQSSGLTESTLTKSATLTERLVVPTWMLTQRLTQGQGLVVGTLDGGRNVGADYFADRSSANTMRK